MKLMTPPNKRALNQSGFTLIEMIGVLAVIAILAAVLIPKVFEAINNARVSNTAMSINSVKTACVDHYAKYGTFPTAGGVATLTPPVSYFDTNLVAEGLMDKPFNVKIGDGGAGTAIQLVPCVAAATVPSSTDTNSFNLAGVSPAVNSATGTWLLEAVITGVTLADARALNAAIDGTSASMGEVSGNDYNGRVEYTKPTTPSDPVTVYVYLTHR